MKTLIIAILSIVLSVAAQFSLKTGITGEDVKAALAQPLSLRAALIVFTDRYVLGGFLLYGLGAVVWLGVLSKWDVSKAYPLVGFGFVLTALVGAVLGEQVTVIRMLGVIMITAGVWLVAST